MARLLGLDWDDNQLHLVSATTGRGGVRIEKAMAIPLNQSVKPAEAEVLGKSLRERLKKESFPLAPAIACVGRDRVILKEIRFPNVPPSQESALVRFQATKDLTESPEDTVLDYTLLAEPGPHGERQALAVIVRKEIPATVAAICKGLGVKLLALTPRPFGVSAALKRAAQPAPAATATLGVLAIGERWAEFCVVQGDSVLFTRALGVGPSLAAEVKRSLAIFTSQARGHGERKLDALYVAGNGENVALREQLHQIVGLPVHPLDPFASEERVEIASANRGGFTGIIGLLHVWAERGSLPINIVHVKEPTREGDPRKKMLLRGGLVAAAILIGFVGLVYFVASKQRSKITELTAQRKQYEESLAFLAQDEKDIKALKEWDQTTISWLDELYELSARFPHRKGLYVTTLTVGPTQKKTGKDAAKDPMVGKITVKGVAPELEVSLINAMVADINRDKTYKALMGSTKGKNFDFQVELQKHPTHKYVTKLPIPKGAKAVASEAGEETVDQ